MKKKEGHRLGLRLVLKPYYGRIIGLSVLTVLQSLLQVAMAVLSRYVIDEALRGGEDLQFWALALAADLLALVIVHGLHSWYQTSTSERFCANARRQILLAAMYSRDARLGQYHSGQLMNRGMEDVNTVCDGAIHALPTLIGQITRLLAAFCVVCMMSTPVALVFLAAAVAVGTLAACFRPVMKKHHRKVRSADEVMMATLQEDLQQLELIQGLGIQKTIGFGFARRIRASLKAKFHRRLWSVSANSLIQALSLAGSGALLLWGAGQVAKGALSYGSMTAMIQLLNLFRAPVLGISGVWNRLAQVEVAAERLQEMLVRQELVEPQSLPEEVTQVVFEDVTFAYPGEDPVLEGFSAKFCLSDWACLTGMSGKGKTTLFKLILGLYQPQQGRVFLQSGGEEIPCTEATRQIFSYVPQDYALFSGTVMENFRLVKPDITEQDLMRALEIAQATFILDTNQGVSTVLGENNTGLSKGQLQRLAIARAVLMDRPVFLLDECTSALDAPTEKAVLENLRGMGKKAIVVTHRPEALEGISGITMVDMNG